jgi:hypothetical protein
VAIIQSILTQLNTKIDSIVKNTERINEIPPINTSNCLTCGSTNLKVIATKRKKKGFKYRTCLCMDCGTTNKQVIMTVSSRNNPSLVTLQDWKLKFLFKPHSIIEKNGKISMGKDWMDKSFKKYVNKNSISKKFGLKEVNNWINIWKKIKTNGKEKITEQFQKNYDDGIFDVVKNSIDPVEIRFVHVFKQGTILSKAQKILFNNSDLKDVNVYLCASCQFIQINETTNSYHFKYIKATVKLGETYAKRNIRNKK